MDIAVVCPACHGGILQSSVFCHLCGTKREERLKANQQFTTAERPTQKDFDRIQSRKLYLAPKNWLAKSTTSAHERAHRRMTVFGMALMPPKSPGDFTAQNVRDFLIYIEKYGRTYVHHKKCNSIDAPAQFKVAPDGTVRVERLSKSERVPFDTCLPGCGRTMKHSSLVTATKHVAGVFKREYNRTGGFCVVTGQGNPVTSAEVRDHLAAISREQQQSQITINKAKEFCLENLLTLLMGVEASRFQDLAQPGAEKFKWFTEVLHSRDLLFLVMCMYTGRRCHDFTSLGMADAAIIKKGSFRYALFSWKMDKTMKLLSTEKSFTIAGTANNDDVITALQKYYACLYKYRCELKLNAVMIDRLTYVIKSKMFFHMDFKSRTANVKRPFSTDAMVRRLRRYANLANLDESLTIKSFRIGCAKALARRGDNLATVMTKVGWKTPKVAEGYLQHFYATDPETIKSNFTRRVK